MSLHWTNLTEKFFDEKQCLASFVAWQAAEVIAGVKPANLINILDRKLACGRNISSLWDKHRTSILAEESLWGIELRRGSDRQLVLIYNPPELEKILQRKPVKSVLARLGYEYDTVDEALAHLLERMQGTDFPHEIGFFLGYPVKDVYGFMGVCDLPVAGHGPWKMYGKLKSSLTVMNQHKAARKTVIDALYAGHDPMALINQAA